MRTALHCGKIMLIIQLPIQIRNCVICFQALFSGSCVVRQFTGSLICTLFRNGDDKNITLSSIGSDNSLPDRFIVICFIECNVYTILLTCESQCQLKIRRFCTISTGNFYHFYK